MSKGTCLCGAVTWEIEGTPESASHCHCTMCRKAHGAPFGTYYTVRAGDFHWTSDTGSVMHYRSSSLGRTFCGKCGSVVPAADDDGERFSVPAGSHQDGPPVDCHIFVGSKAPWHEIEDDLPRHHAFPPGSEDPVLPDVERGAKPEGLLRGSCLCGAVEFEVAEPFKAIQNCHCSRCRRARAAAFTTNGFTAMDAVTFTRGREHVTHFKLPDARYFTQAFCDTCGSKLPRLDPERGIAVIPLGALDDDPGCRASCHIYTRYRAAWYEPGKGLPAFEEGPPS